MTVCLVDATGMILQCGDASGNGFSLPIEKADRYVCMSPTDAEALFDYIATKCMKVSMVRAKDFSPF